MNEEEDLGETWVTSVAEALLFLGALALIVWIVSLFDESEDNFTQFKQIIQECKPALN